MKRKLLALLLVVLMLISLCSCSFGGGSNSSFSIRFIDVGQGDSALVECDGHYMLIDGGDKSAGDTVYNVLKDEKIQKLDILAVSHHDADHIGGLAKALTYASSIGVTISNSEYSDSAQFREFQHQLGINGSKITVPAIDQEYKLGSATVKVVDVSAQEKNDSLVLMVTYGDNKFLFTGDIEAKAQERITEKYMNDADEPYKVDLIKMPHHGSYSSSTVGTTNSLILFMRTFMPDYAVISVGNMYRYRHPHTETLDLLNQLGAKVYRTDTNGDIIVKSNGNEISITTEK